MSTNSYSEVMLKQIQAVISDTRRLENFKIVGVFKYDAKSYNLYKEYVGENKFDEIVKLSDQLEGSKDELVLVSFNKNRSVYYALFFDNDDLWQDPVLMDVIQEKKR